MYVAALSTTDLQLHGIHYFDNFAKDNLASIPNFESFLQEFNHMVSERRLQHTFGLKLKHKEDLDNKVSWAEFELPEKRSTIMLQDGMPMPERDFDCNVSTEWVAVKTKDDAGVDEEVTCRHCNHCKNHHGGSCGVGYDKLEAAFCLGGQRVVQRTPLHDLVSAIVLVI
ncbi:hypothetical protein DL98DRAFT_551350 [Cadophora sp. DSE1049]|nr:hypothetical protein DL98DRAFT_551350 [Cadophora sp. DSE1049]